MKEMRLAFVDCRNKTRKARTGLMGLEDEKRTLIMSGKIDKDALSKLDEQIVKFSTEIMGEELKMNREILSLLTPKQMEILVPFPGRMGPGKRPKKKE